MGPQPIIEPLSLRNHEKWVHSPLLLFLVHGCARLAEILTVLK